MFGALSQKVIAGFVSLSMMLFSSYEGNEPEFSNISVSLIEKNIFLKTELVGAFENDFDRIFRLGQRIEIEFEINVKSANELLFDETFLHTVQYDPLENTYSIVLQDRDETFTTDSYDDMISEISKIEYLHRLEKEEDLKICIEASLPIIRIESENKEHDLMMLWKFKKPKKTIIIQDINEI